MTKFSLNNYAYNTSHVVLDHEDRPAELRAARLADRRGDLEALRAVLRLHRRAVAGRDPQVHPQEGLLRRPEGRRAATHR